MRSARRTRLKQTLFPDPVKKRYYVSNSVMIEKRRVLALKLHDVTLRNVESREIGSASVSDVC